MKNKIPLRRKITYVGSVISILIGFKVAMLGYMAIGFGLFILVAGPFISYLIGFMIEKAVSKHGGMTTKWGTRIP